MAEPTILIVDDQVYITEVTMEYLRFPGLNYQFLTAENGLEALKVIDQQLPDLIITDWDMPEMNGIELVKTLKSNTLTQDIPIIVNSGVNIDSNDLSLALEVGANEFLRKPVDPIELQARVKSMLQLSKSIREIKQQQKEINQQLAFQKTLINTISYPVYYYSIIGDILGYNDVFAQLFPSIVNMQNPTILHLFVLDGVDIHLQNDRELIRTKKPIRYEHQISYLDESRHTIIFTKSPYFGDNNILQGIICIMVDITELKDAHNQILETKTKDLTSKTIKLLQNSELNSKMINDLQQLSRHTNRKGELLIKSIISTYQLTNNEKNWEDFDLRFKEVHSGFYERLHERFTNLSPNETKLCAFLKLNMSTKEIAAITFQNPQSIDMARHRLRKKLDLAKDVNLITFIADL